MPWPPPAGRCTEFSEPAGLLNSAAWKLDTEYVKKAAIYLPGIKPEKKPAKMPSTSPGIQYWLPPGHNSWVGDVATLSYHGRYHVFYLYDRRHHQSKFGCGAHYFEHISTEDFRTWTEHEAATPLEEAMGMHRHGRAVRLQ